MPQQQPGTDPAEIRELGEALRFGDIPGGQSMSQFLEMDPQDPYMGELFELTAQRQMEARQQVGSFWEHFPQARAFPVPQPGLLPLIALPTGDTLSITERELCQGMLITGPPGSGKTSFLRNLLLAGLQAGISFVCFDSKDEREDLLDCEALCSPYLPIMDIHARELQIAVCQWPSDLSREHGITKIVEEFAGTFSLHASRRMLLHELHELLETRGGCTLLELIEKIERVRNQSPFGSTVRYKETLTAALEELNLSMGTAVRYRRSSMLQEILAFPGLTLIRTAALSDRVRSWLACRFIGWAFEERGVRGADCSRPICFVLDDALGIVRGDWREAEQGVSPVPNWSLQGRSRRLGLCVSAHSFSYVSPVLRANTSTTICCRALGRDADELGKHFRLSSREQYDSLSRLSPGEAVVFSSIWPQAVWGRFPPSQPRQGGENWPRRRAAEFLAQFRERGGGENAQQTGRADAGAARTGEARSQDSGSWSEEKSLLALPYQELPISENAKRVLLKVNSELCFLSKVYFDLDLGGRRGGKAVRELADAGLVMKRDFVRNGRGRKPVALEVTARGLELLARIGVGPREKKLKGEWEHNFYGEVYLRALVRSRGLRHKFEFTSRGELGAKTFDMMAWNSEGVMTGYEVVVSGRAKANAERIRKGLRIEGIAEVVVCCKEKKLMNDIEKELSGEKKASFLFLGDLHPLIGKKND